MMEMVIFPNRLFQNIFPSKGGLDHILHSHLAYSRLIWFTNQIKTSSSFSHPFMQVNPLFFSEVMHQSLVKRRNGTRLQRPCNQVRIVIGTSFLIIFLKARLCTSTINWPEQHESASISVSFGPKLSQIVPHCPLYNNSAPR